MIAELDKKRICGKVEKEMEEHLDSEASRYREAEEKELSGNQEKENKTE